MSNVASSAPITADEGRSAVLARNWWMLALRGVLAILFGVLTFVLPVVALQTWVLLFAAYMIVDGVVGIASGLRAAARHERWGWLILEGVASVLAGLMAILWPLITIVVFVYLVAVWAGVSGVFMAIAAFRARLPRGRYLLALAGGLSILFSVVLMIAPIAGALVLVLYLGAYGFAFGIMLLILAWRLRDADAAPGSRVPA